MKKQVTFVHNKWYLLIFVIGYSIICGLQIHSYLTEPTSSTSFMIFWFWLITMTPLSKPNRSRYQVLAFRYASFGVAVTWAVKIFATQHNPTFYLICLPMLVFAVLPTRFLDRHFRSGK